MRTPNALTAAFCLALFAGPALAGPPAIRSLVDEGWVTLTETPTMRVYYKIDAAPTADGHRRVTMVVDMPNRSMRMIREFDCARAQTRNRGATLYPQQGLRGEGREFQGWDRWMGFLSYPDARDPSDYNGMLSDAVCPENVPSQAEAH